MRSLLRPLTVLVGGLVLLPLVAPAQGKNQKNRKNAPYTRKSAPSELPVVKRVAGDRITIGEKEYVVTERTEITVDGEKADLADVRPGMQASVSGGVLKYGRTKAETTYKATRISARADNKLDEKRKAHNKKQAERARRNNRNQRRR